MPAETKVKDYPVVDCTLIGKRVREARKSSHMTQEELAEKCSCTPTHICNLENGKIGISLELLFRIRKRKTSAICRKQFGGMGRCDEHCPIPPFFYFTQNDRNNLHIF